MTATTKHARRNVKSPQPGKVDSQLLPSGDVSEYYRETIDDYQTWSRDGYMHFGLWRPGINPFNRKSMLEAMNDLVFNELKLSSMESAVIGDLGCGVGAVANYGAKKYPEHQWRAYTVCPEQVAFGSKRLFSRRTRIALGDFHHLPLADESLDAAFFLESICHSDRLDKAMLEAHRVLKPGGRLVVIDGLMKKDHPKRSRVADWVANAVSENWAVPQFHSVSEVNRAIQIAGFEVVRKRELSLNVAPSVLHSIHLIIGHSTKLLLTGKLTSWKRKHLIGCTLAILLGLQRRQFGYYIYSLVKG